MSESNYPTIRELTRADRVRLSALIESLAEKSGDIKITELVPQASAEGAEGSETVETDKIYDLIKSVLGGLIKWCNEDLTAWFMEITGTATIEEFNAMPFDVDTYIIDQLVQRDSFINFFSKASELYKRIRGLIK